jgi:hypothetical protein
MPCELTSTVLPRLEFDADLTPALAAVPLEPELVEAALLVAPELLPLLLPHALRSAATASAGRMTFIEVFTLVLLTWRARFVGTLLLLMTPRAGGFFL